MSLVTTAKSIPGQRRLLSESTRAVFPLPTGPATPTRKARFMVIIASEQKIALRHGQRLSRLAGQQLAVGADFISLRVHLQFCRRCIVDHVRLAEMAAGFRGADC